MRKARKSTTDFISFEEFKRRCMPSESFEVGMHAQMDTETAAVELAKSSLRKVNREILKRAGSGLSREARPHK